VVHGYVERVSDRIESRERAEGYIALVCFKHGPPTRQGLELEWTVHQRSDPDRRLDTQVLQHALGPLAPTTISPDSPHRSLPAGSRVTVEPGGQLEISTAPSGSVSALIEAARTDIDTLRGILAGHGLVLGQLAGDPRPPRRLLHTPRYDALEAAFDLVGPLGRQMMNSTASLQVCVDAGERSDLGARWQAVHAFGPALVALFANSPSRYGAGAGWASARLHSVLGMSPCSTTPPEDTSDPVGHWTSLVMAAPLVAIRRPGRSWTPPQPMSFADWIAAGAGDHGAAPTFDDLDYHLTTLFPVVRPRGYLEVRYLDQQPGDGWVAAAALVAALLVDPATVDRALEAAEPGRGRWVAAARNGLAEPGLRQAAEDLVELGLGRLTELDLSAPDQDLVTEQLSALLGHPAARRHTGWPALAGSGTRGREPR